MRPSAPEGGPGGEASSAHDAPGLRASARDAALAEEGWVRRFVGAPPRLQEMKELYESLGLEVRLEPLTDEELAEECAGCTLALALFRVLYTRRSP